MYLKSLTLKGFKSFAQPTTFAFEPGVTCVVGPNGSGKSNVVDALAWVMGEQGAKTLRGGKMEDVIFAGTSTRGPLGRAEVLLTIDNSDGALPIEYSEVTISRTLFRNGSSEYAINGENCRLLDVQELLSDSGLGREMHVIVGQGRLDNVLQASPEDRRGFIEEAAGILKHRRRKEKTVRKLEAMQANLTRLTDLATEVRRQLKPLGHQAEIAREAQSIQAEVRDARARILADDVVQLRTTLDAHNKTESERHSERIVLQEQLERTMLRVRRLEADQSADDVESARKTVFALESIQERLRGLYNLANQRLALLGADTDQQPLGSGVNQAMIEGAESEVEVMRGIVTAAEAAWQAAQQATVVAREKLDSIDEQISAQSALVSQHDLELTSLRGKKEAADSALAAVRGEVLRQQNALDAATERRVSAQENLAQVESDSADTTAGETGLNDTYEAAQAAVVEADATIDRLRDELHTLERERDALQARTGALSMALDQKDGSSALVKAKLSGIRGLVAEHIQVKAGFEAAIAAGLGSLSDAVLADDMDSAISALANVDRDDLGRVEIVVAAKPGKSAVSLPSVAGVVPASDVVTAPEGVLALLASTVIADDLDAARAAWKQGLEKSDANVTIITKAGEVLTRFVLRGGSGSKQSRIELVSDRDAAQKRLDEVIGLIDKARLDLADQRGVAQVAKERSTAALAALREYDSQLAARSEALNRARVQVEAAIAESERLSASLALAAASVEEAEQNAHRATSELESVESRPRPILDVSARDELFAELEQVREKEVQSRLELETARERVRAEELRVEGLRQQLEADRAAAEEAARRAVVRRRQIDAAAGVAEALPAVLDSVDRSVSEARVLLGQREADRAAQNQELITLRQEESQLRERLHSITENVHGLELQIYEKKMQLSGLLERAGNELGLVEDVLIAEYGPEVGIPVALDADAPADAEPETKPYNRSEQQTRLEKAERKLGQLGRVNPLALEEFAALEQRHTFLTEQLTDLTNTRKDLMTIIEEVDSTMQSVFQAAFDDTQAAFAEVFPILFPGGSGSIALTNPDDLLTTGIEVIVKPAGKKIDRLSLLSGGERSLAAVALLVAIFKARPSPFYIMDEVEAALDDANLGRLLAIFEDLRNSSQLIVITHQKRTMEIADALYGVSMRQDGVSAVVGQRVAAKESTEKESA
ncbi:chromosome segregation protein [Aurantimicrobium minutum]|uniref:chromosome segregation protein SMC n=1 Tax=Aurantimicrobium minutum TaxID=708131 RepID=UPI0024754035|nr:chromosome segregation protein SMC [Aurantimicrobium minutum]MDH6424425.1 chromosome segregation protein [Aurantimicrobium minutum]